jgi:6-phosphogluconate dehydrogenase
VYDLLKNVAGISILEIRDLFADWNASDLNSYLLEIATLVLGKRDPESGKPLVELILDEAEQKGTGKWTAQDSMDLGVAVPTLAYAVEARILSGQREERVAASKILKGPGRTFSSDGKQWVAQLRKAYRIAVITCYAQGFEQLRVASAEYKYNLQYPDIARIWKGGCIIRAKLLDPIQQAFISNPSLPNLMLDAHFSSVINEDADSLREVVRTAVDLGVPCVAFTTSLGYIDSYRRERLPANLLQALRDCFGAHTYHRTDKPGTYHTEWTK